MFVLAGCATASFAQTGSPRDPETILDEGLKVPWRDDGVGHPDLIAFRNRLITAIKNHDAQTILQAADSDFRGCDMQGLDGLRKYLLACSRYPGGWGALYDSLTEGGVLSSAGTVFASNYAVSLFPQEKTGVIGPEYFNVIAGRNVPVYEHPSSASRIFIRLSSNIVIPVGAVKSGWQQIEYKRDRRGYIAAKDLLSPIGMSIEMKRRNGRWRLTGIITYCD